MTYIDNGTWWRRYSFASSPAVRKARPDSCAGGVVDRPPYRARIVGHRVRRCDPGRRQYRPGQRDLPGEHHDRHPVPTGRSRQRADHLAVQRLLIETALPGDQQIGVRDLLAGSGVRRRSGRRRTRGGRREPAVPRRARRPPPRRGPADRAAGDGLDFARPMSPTGPRVARRSPGRHPSAGRRPTPLRSGRAADARRRWRRPDPPRPVCGPPRRSRRGLRPSPARRRCSRCRPSRRQWCARRTGEPRRSAVPRPCCARPSAVSTVGGPPSRCKSAGLRGFDVGRRRRRVVHPPGVDVLRQRAPDAGLPGLHLRVAGGQNLDEARPAVGLRRQHQPVVGSGPSPARRRSRVRRPPRSVVSPKQSGAISVRRPAGTGSVIPAGYDSPPGSGEVT